jgi:uncharacterized protein (TIGR03067 family)
MIANEDRQRLQGTWEIIFEEKGGEALKPGPFSICFKGDAVTNPADPNGSKTTFRVDPHKRLPTLTAVQKADKGITVVYLYEWKGDVLRLCVSDDEKEQSRPPPAFDSKDGRRILICKRR